MKMIKQFPSLTVMQFSLILAIYFGVILNAPLTFKMYEASQDSMQFLFTVPLILSSVFFPIFYVLSIPYLRKPFFVFLTLSSSMASYAIYKYKILFNYDMMVNIAQTYVGEMLSYINLSSVSMVVIFGLVPSLFIVFTKFKPVSLKTHLFTVVSSVALTVLIVAGCYKCFYKEYASVGRNNHYLNSMVVPAHFYNGVKYIYRNYIKQPVAYKTVGEDARQVKNPNDKPSLVILMLGETARAQNYAYNGYTRETTPFTSPLNLVRIPNVQSCGTATAVSVPCMFSNTNRENYNAEQVNNQDNVLDIVNRAGVNVVWLENDGGDKGVAQRITMREIQHDSRSYCNGTTCYDGVFLQEFDKELATLKSNTQQDTLMVMHLIGSHGPTYYQRYPKDMRQFTPTCDRSDIENCTDEEIRNAYDNTIVYTDWVMRQMIDKLKTVQEKYEVALIYLSDHGESLGENGFYLHGAPFSFAPQEQTHVPWMMWFGETFANKRKIDTQELQKKVRLKQYTQDYLFSSLLSLMRITTKAFNKDLSLF